MDADFAQRAVGIIGFAKGNLDAAMNQQEPEQIHAHVEAARTMLGEILREADEWFQSQEA